MTPFIVTLLVITSLLLTRFITNLVNLSRSLAPFQQPQTAASASCSDCYANSDCAECAPDCNKCAVSCPPNCATCSPSCSKCAADCPLDCNKCAATCPPNCDLCKANCPPDCAKLARTCDLPFMKCQRFIKRLNFSGGYLTSISRMNSSLKGSEMFMRFIPRQPFGGLFGLPQMGFYIRDNKVSMYLRGETRTQIRTFDDPVNLGVTNKLKFRQDFTQRSFVVSVNNNPKRFNSKVPSEVFNSVYTFGKCVGRYTPEQRPFIGCMTDLQINNVPIKMFMMNVTGQVAQGCE